MKLKCVMMGLIFMMSGMAFTTTASADLLPAKAAGTKCDQGALVTYNAFVSARNAVFAAYESEINRAKEKYELAQKTGTPAQRKNAKTILLAAKATALHSRNLALSQLGVSPRFPVGCKSAQS